MDKLKDGGDDAKQKRIEYLKTELDRLMETVRDDIDVAKIDEIVAELDLLDPVDIPYTTEEHLEEFYKYYFPLGLKAREEMAKLENSKKKREYRTVKVWKVGFASFVFLFALNAVTVLATGENLWNPIVEWVGGTIQKSYRGNLQNENAEINHADHIISELKDYIDIENEYGVLLLKPQYFPDGYVFDRIDSFETSHKTTFAFFYLNYTSELIYRLSIRKNDTNSYNEIIEVTPEIKTEYVKDGITYYIFENFEIHGTTFDHMGISYFVSGFNSKEEVILFIDNLLM